jgi:hypothetical protein
MLYSSRRRDQQAKLWPSWDENRREPEVSDPKLSDSLPCDNCPVSGPLSVRVALMERDINAVRDALYGDGKARQALIPQVEQLVKIADRGRFSLRVALWLGGGIVAATTAIAQFKQAILGIFHH